MATIELTRFRVAPEQTEALLAARPAMLEAFRADRAGFLGADLLRLNDGESLDIVGWRSPEDFAASRAKGPNRPEIASFFVAIAELLSSEQGTLVDAEQDGQRSSHDRRLTEATGWRFCRR